MNRPINPRIASVILIVIVLAGTLTGVLNTYTLIALVIIYVTGLYFLNRQQTTLKIKECLKSSTADALVNYYELAIKKQLPEADFVKAYSQALAFFLYGDFDRAMATLDKYDMSQKPDAYQAMQLNGYVVNSYLRRQDLKEGLHNAVKSKALAKIKAGMPGKKTLLNSYNAYIEIGEILNGEATDLSIARLEDRLKKSTILMQLIIAWGLGVYYHQQGNGHKETEMMEFIQTNAPHCRAIQSFEG